jgi:hypothetical protein
MPLLNDTPLIHFHPLLSFFQPKWGISEIVYEGFLIDETCGRFKDASIAINLPLVCTNTCDLAICYP